MALYQDLLKTLDQVSEFTRGQTNVLDIDFKKNKGGKAKKTYKTLSDINGSSETELYKRSLNATGYDDADRSNSDDTDCKTYYSDDDFDPNRQEEALNQFYLNRKAEENQKKKSNHMWGLGIGRGRYLNGELTRSVNRQQQNDIIISQQLKVVHDGMQYSNEAIEESFNVKFKKPYEKQEENDISENTLTSDVREQQSSEAKYKRTEQLYVPPHLRSTMDTSLLVKSEVFDGNGSCDDESVSCKSSNRTSPVSNNDYPTEFDVDFNKPKCLEFRIKRSDERHKIGSVKTRNALINGLLKKQPLVANDKIPVSVKGDEHAEIDEKTYASINNNNTSEDLLLNKNSVDETLKNVYNVDVKSLENTNSSSGSDYNSIYEKLSKSKYNGIIHHVDNIEQEAKPVTYDDLIKISNRKVKNLTMEDFMTDNVKCAILKQSNLNPDAPEFEFRDTFLTSPSSSSCDDSFKMDECDFPCL